MHSENDRATPLVSIIIPTYNSREYICEAVESALNQTYRNCEVIVIDDGSTDDTKELLYKYGSKIRYFYQENRGVAAARNRGIRLAQGDYFQFLDADDLILPRKIELQLQFLENTSDCGVVYTDCRHFEDSDRDKLIDPGYKHWTGHVFEKLIWENLLPVNAALVKKGCIDEVGLFWEELPNHEDWELWLRIAYAGYKFHYMDEVLTLCRSRGGSLSSNRVDMMRGRLTVLKIAKGYVTSHRLRRELRTLEILKCYELDKALIEFVYKKQGLFELMRFEFSLLCVNPIFMLRRETGRLLVILLGEKTAQQIAAFIKKLFRIK